MVMYNVTDTAEEEKKRKEEEKRVSRINDQFKLINYFDLKLKLTKVSWIEIILGREFLSQSPMLLS